MLVKRYKYKDYSYEVNKVSWLHYSFQFEWKVYERRKWRNDKLIFGLIGYETFERAEQEAKFYIDNLKEILCENN